MQRSFQDPLAFTASVGSWVSCPKKTSLMGSAGNYASKRSSIQFRAVDECMNAKDLKRKAQKRRVSKRTPDDACLRDMHANWRKLSDLPDTPSNAELKTRFCCEALGKFIVVGNILVLWRCCTTV